MVTRHGAGRGHVHRTFWLLTALAMAVAVAVGGAVVYLTREIVVHHRARTALFQVHSLAARQELLEQQALEGPSRDLGQIHLANAQAMSAAVRSAVDLVGRDHHVGDVARAVEAFTAQHAEVTGLALAGDAAAATKLDQEHADPALEALDQALLQAVSSLDRETAAEQRTDDRAFILLLVLGASLVTALVARAGRLRRSAAVAAAEQQTLERSEARFRSLAEHSSDLLTVLDPNRSVAAQSESVTTILGWAPERLVGSPFAVLVHPDDLGAFDQGLAQAASRAGTPVTVEARLARPDGSWCWVEAKVTNLLANPDVGGFVINSRDISERRALEDQLRHQAFHDPLTNLANRALFRDRLEHGVARQGRTHELLAVLLIDLDDFKAVNDTLGHPAGDKLLGAVAERLRACTRDSDTLARLGGDEFAILAEDLADNQVAIQLAERVLEALRAPFVVDGHPLSVSGSVGIALSSSDMAGPDQILQYADVALYATKNDGKGRYTVFEPAMQLAIQERLQLKADLAEAIGSDQLSLRYQPIVEVTGETVVGVEALVRWQHPRRGAIAPLEFIPLAEETGLIVPLGRWIFHQACRQMRQWEAAMPRTTFTMSINVSPRQLDERDFLTTVTRILVDTGVDPTRLVFEITESEWFGFGESNLDTLRALRDVGIRLAIDDFGTGYSSLSRVQHLPIDILKVDRCFVAALGQETDGTEFARAILSLGRAIDVQTVAEGVETAEQLHELTALRCDLAQGFYFAEPLSQEAAGALLAGTTPPVKPTPSRQRGRALQHDLPGSAATPHLPSTDVRSRR